MDGANTETDGETSADSNTITLEVVLDTTEKYLVSIKTMQNFSITTTNDVTYKNNKIDIEFSKVGDTQIKEPSKFLSKDDKDLTEEDFKNYYEKCKKWHKVHTGADIYEGN